MQNNAYSLNGLGHIGIFISDIDTSVSFYQKLGFEVAAQYQRPNGVVLTFMKAGSCILELIRPIDPTLLGRSAGVVDHVCMAVTNIEAYTEALKAQGIIDADAVVGSMPDVMDGSKNIFFRGPDGERLELFESPMIL